MFRNSIFLLLLLGVIGRVISSEHRKRNNSLVLPENEQSHSLLLVNPEQVKSLEETIRRFLSTLAEPINKPIILRSTGNNLQSSIREMCDSMRNKLMGFAEDCNLTTTAERYRQSSKELPVSSDWFSEAMLQIAFLLRDVGDMVNEIGDKIKKHFGERSIVSPKSQQPMQHSEDLEFLGVIYDAADFGERLSHCLNRLSKLKRQESPFDIKHILLNIAKNPPEIAVEVLESSLQYASTGDIPKNRARSNWHAYFCRSMIKHEGAAAAFRNCVQDLQNLERCVQSPETRSVNRGRKNEENQWLKAIEQLSDCEVRTDEDGIQKVICKSGSKMPKTVQQKMKYTFEKILDRKISKRSTFHRAVRDLSDTLSKKPWGRKLSDQCYQFSMIYDNGLQKLKRSSVLAARDSRAAAKHRKVLGAFQVYRNGAFERIFGAIGGLHRSTTEFEKFLVGGVQNIMNESWQSHMKIMSCMMDWMNKVLQFYSDNGSGLGEKPPETNKVAEESNESDNWSSEFFESDKRRTKKASRHRSAALGRAEASMDNFIESMNRVSRVRSTNDTSMLAGLTNNLLLVTMFVETLGFVSTLYCFEHGMKNETEPPHFEDDNRLTR
nr:uncharacterized protein LOC117224103 [Megalopta genalis]